MDANPSTPLNSYVSTSRGQMAKEVAQLALSGLRF
jgi:hypothetical protein